MGCSYFFEENGVEQKNFGKAEGYYGKAEKFVQGDPELQGLLSLAYCNLGYSYFFGKNRAGQKDFTKAEGYYGKAEKFVQGDAILQKNLSAAYFDLGKSYFFGINGAEQDPDKAEECCKKSEELEHSTVTGIEVPNITINKNQPAERGETVYNSR
ncbi:hypothetical protein AGMMS49592_3970 [Endomicrobiia bacterium]|nr:hypothetical protein AGMMS49592_3970 [Endomicrobiia bacterium]